MSRSFNVVFFMVLVLSVSVTSWNCAHAQTSATDVIAFWGFAADYDFDDGADGPNFQDFAPDVNNTVGTPNLQAYLGDASNLDDNGGGSTFTYTSPVSGITYQPTRTIKWDDLKGGGNDFTIGSEGPSFNVDKNDGAGVVPDDFGNDALLYFTLDATGYQDLEIRFDIEGTPGDLPETFDIFYRTTGPNSTWIRDANQDEIPLPAFVDYPTPDPGNQFSDSGYHNLNSALNNQSLVEIILSDFAEFGNNEMEIDNIEIVGSVFVPEPNAISLTLIAGLSLLGLRRRRR